MSVPIEELQKLVDEWREISLGMSDPKDEVVKDCANELEELIKGEKDDV